MKTDPKVETQKRLKILCEITNFIKKNGLPVVSSRVGGSLAFAKNFAITKTSDIDLDLFISFKKVYKLNPLLEFLHAERTFRQGESWDDFDLLASYGKFKNVEINIWIFNTDTFEDIAKFKKDYIRYFTKYKPSDFKKYNIFGGGTCQLDRHVEKYRDGYKSQRYILHNGKVLSENYVLNNMFFVFPILGGKYSKKIVNFMWDAFLDKYKNVTEKQFNDFIIENVKDRYSPEFKDKLHQLIQSRLKHN